MTVEEFADKCGKEKATVLKWIQEDYIPGIAKVDGEYIIPNSARRPYTENRAKNGKAILKSLVKACEKQCGICAALYNISEAAFNNYIETLEKEGYISPFTEDDIKYFNVTVKGAEWIKPTLKPSDWITAVNAVATTVSAGSTLI